MNILRRFTQNLLLIGLLAILAACGGGGGGLIDTPPSTTPDPNTGVLYDAPLANVGYDGSFPGTTNDSGQFQYAAGDSLVFTLGNFSFSAVPAGPQLGLVELLQATELDNRVINLARLLQSIDTNSDEDAITLPDTIDIDLSALDFSLSLADFEADATVQALLGQYGNQTNPLTLIPAQEAVNHLYSAAQALAVELPEMSASLDNDGDRLLNIFDPDDDNDGTEDINDVDADGDGLIELSSLEQLDWMRNDLAGNSLNDDVNAANSSGCPASDGCVGYELTTDLDFNNDGDAETYSVDDAFYNGGEGWVPVGEDGDPFIASFEGNGYSISNLYINRDSDNQGLFGVVGDDGVTPMLALRNIHLLGGSVAGDDQTGSLVGLLEAGDSTVSIINCSSSTAVTADFYGTTNFLGGLLGRINNAENGIIDIVGSYTSGPVSGGTGTSSMGGLIGFVIADGTVNISDSFSSSTVTEGRYYTGGFIGNADTGSNGALNLRNCSSTGAVTAEFSAGGLIGYGYFFSPVSIIGCYSTGTITGGNKTGGLLGDLENYDDLTIRNSFRSGDIVGDGRVGGLIGGLSNSGNFSTVDIRASFLTGTISGDSDIGGLIGWVDNGTDDTLHIEGSFVSAAVSGNTSLGAFMGDADDNGSSYAANYYNSSAPGVGVLNPVADGIDPGTGVIGYPLSDLQCPTTADDGNCLPTPYVGWNSYLNDDSNPVWDFGTTAELPGLIIDGVVYRDIDGDGNITASKLAD